MSIGKQWHLCIAKKKEMPFLLLASKYFFFRPKRTCYMFYYMTVLSYGESVEPAHS